jgi:hypothetical protein
MFDMKQEYEQYMKTSEGQREFIEFKKSRMSFTRYSVDMLLQDWLIHCQIKMLQIGEENV